MNENEVVEHSLAKKERKSSFRGTGKEGQGSPSGTTDAVDI